MPLRALATGGEGPLFIWAPATPSRYTRPL